MPLTVLLAISDRDRWGALDAVASALKLSFRSVNTGEEALEEAETTSPGLVIAGTDLLDMHALDLCRRIRRKSDVPLIVLASETAELDRVLALELGADDVIGEGCEDEEFRERVKAALRRSTGVEVTRADGDVLDFGHIVIDRSQQRLTIGGETRGLTPMEMELMWALGESAGEVLESEGLLERVWGYPRGLQTRTLDVHIGRLRRKLGEDGRNPRHIITVRSVGYRFEPDGEDAGGDEVAGCGRAGPMRRHSPALTP